MEDNQKNSREFGGSSWTLIANLMQDGKFQGPVMGG